MGAFDDLIPGGGGGAPATNTDKTQAEEARKTAMEARTGMVSMGHLYDISSRYEGGIPQAAINAVKSGVGATDQASQDYRLFNSMAQRAAIGKAATLKPVSNTDIALLISSGANPALSARNNKMLLGQDYKPLARTLLESRMKANWIERYGSLTAKSPKGRTFGDAVRQAYGMPQVKAAMKPLDEVVKAHSKVKAKFLGFE